MASRAEADRELWFGAEIKDLWGARKGEPRAAGLAAGLVCAPGSRACSAPESNDDVRPELTSPFVDGQLDGFGGDLRSFVC
jgi:hypothetical protein